MGPNGLPDFVSDCMVSDVVFVWEANSFQSISSPWPAVSSGCPRSMTRFRRRTRVPRQSGSPWVSMSLIFELREIFLSFQITQMVFSFDRAAVICAILDSTLSLEPWSVMTVPTHLKLSILSSFLPLTLMSTLKPFFIRHQFGLLSRRSTSPLFMPSHKCHQQNISWWLFCPRHWLFLYWVSHNSLKKNVQESWWEKTALSDFDGHSS